MDERLIIKAIEIAKNNPDDFCVNLLQKNLRIGCIKSAKLIEELENRGIIGPYNPRKNRRKVLIQ